MPAHLIESLSVSGYGSAAASGGVSFYAPGTLVPAQVFADDALSTPLSQPVALDAAGRSTYPVYTAVPVRAIIRAANGSTLLDVARLNGDRAELVALANASFPSSSTVDAALTALGSSLGGTNGQYLAPGAGAVARKLQTVVADLAFDVKNYGAAGTGIADDTTPIQNAITACIAAGGGTVYFPPGNFLISSALQVSPTSTAALAFAGAGIGASVITATNAAQNAITTGGSFLSGLTVSNLSVAHSTTSTGAAFAFGTSSTMTVAFYNVATGASTGTVGYRNNILHTAGILKATLLGVTFQAVSGDSSSLNVSLRSGGTAFLTVVGSTLTQAALGDVLHPGAGSVTASASTFGSTSGTNISITSTASIYEAGNFFGASTAVALGASAGFSQITSVSGFSITDARTGAPVNYSLSTSSAVTPLPLETPTVRIVATAAITVTVNAISATGWGRKWTLTCLNSSGGSVTWSFAAQYHLSGAVAPTNGNRVNLLLEYDPVSNTVVELGRAATTI